MLISNVVVDWFNNTLHALLLLLDEVVYWTASQCYQLFIKLASTRIFEDSFFANFANRIYAILGIFMLFYLAYALLTAIIDPEKLAKGDKGVSKIATNLVISLVILGFLPTIFSYAYRMQNYVLSSNLIGSLILGTPVNETNQDTMVKYGDALSFTVLNTFLNPDNDNFTIDNNYSWFDFKGDVLNNSDYTALPAMNKAVSTGAVVNGGVSQVIFYMPVISTIAGIFLVYVMLSFTIDLGIRVVKFAFYQLLAPIPVIMRIVPGKKGTFDKWLKQTISVYFEVFVRVGIMYIGIYFINAIATDPSLMKLFFESKIQGKLAFAIIIMGILAFIKQAPKMLSEVLGIDTGGMKLGIKEKLKAGGFFAAGSALGVSITSGFNPFAIARAWKSGMKDGDFKSIGKEAALRRKVLDERANGSTWTGRRLEDIRGAFGFESRADQMNRQIENMAYRDEHGNPYIHRENVLDANGNVVDVREVEVDKAYIERRKHELTTQNAEIDAVVNRNKVQIQQNDSAINYRKSIREEAVKQIERRDRHYADRTLTDFGYGVFSGNYQELSDFIKQLEENSAPDVSTYTGGASNPTYQADMQAHAQKINQYKAELNNLKEQMRDEFINQVMSGTTNNAVIQNAIASLNSDLANDAVTTSVNAVTNVTELEQVFRDASGTNSSLNLYNYNAESMKRPNTQEIVALDRAEAVHKEQQQAAKQTNRYLSAQANKNSRNSGGK